MILVMLYSKLDLLCPGVSHNLKGIAATKPILMPQQLTIVGAENSGWDLQSTLCTLKLSKATWSLGSALITIIPTYPSAIESSVTVVR